MSFESSIVFDNEASFTYESDYIEFDSGSAKFIAIDETGKIFSEDFADDTGFTYDSAKAEFISGGVRQKPVVVANENLYAAPFDVSGIATRAIGTNTVTLIGGASVVDYNSKKYYDASGLVTGKYVDFNADNAQYGGVGTFRFKLIPQYSGNASGIVDIFTVSGDADANRVGVYHNGSDLYIIVVRNTGITQGLSNIGAWSPVAGQEYEFELNVNVTAGQTSLYIDGVLKGSSAASPGFTSTITKLQLGRDSGKSNYYFRDFEVFSVVKHTSDFAGEIPRAINNYYGSRVDLPAFSYTGIGSVQSTDDSTIVEVGAPRYLTAGAYWTGTMWFPSNGTYAQANTLQEIFDNIGTFPTAGGSSIVFSVLFNDSVELSSVSSVVVEYTGQQYFTGSTLIRPNSSVLADGMFSITATDNASGSAEIKYLIRLQDANYYYDGASWSISNNTVAQGNTIQEINDNISTFDMSAGGSLTPVVVTSSVDGVSQIDVSAIGFTYDFFVSSPGEIDECLVYCFLEDLMQDADDFSTAKLYAQVTAPFVHGEKLFLACEFVSEFNESGYAEISLVETTTVNKKISFRIEYVCNGETKTVNFKPVVIPQSASVNLLNIARVL